MQTDRPKAETQECPQGTAVIADDHGIVGDALRSILTERLGCKVLGQATDGLQAIALCTRHQPDLLTLDSAMPVTDGRTVFTEVRRAAPRTRVCLVTGLTGQDHLRDWVEAGVEGVVFKSCPTEDIAACFETVLRGGRYMSPAVLAVLERHDPMGLLTRREREVLDWLLLGQTNGEIATRLSISPKTVDNHRTRLMGKLGVHSLSELLAFALREGVLEPRGPR